MERVIGTSRALVTVKMEWLSRAIRVTAAGKPQLPIHSQEIQQQPTAIQLRYLQTLVEIGAEHNMTIVFPPPIDLITSMTHVLNGSKRIEAAAA